MSFDAAPAARSCAITAVAADAEFFENAPLAARRALLFIATRYYAAIRKDVEERGAQQGKRARCAISARFPVHARCDVEHSRRDAPRRAQCATRCFIPRRRRVTSKTPRNRKLG